MMWSRTGEAGASTAAMIEAGLNAMSEFVPEWDSDEAIVAAVFAAMLMASGIGPAPAPVPRALRPHGRSPKSRPME